MSYLKDEYIVLFNTQVVGHYYVYTNREVSYVVSQRYPIEIESDLKLLNLDRDQSSDDHIQPFSDLINESNRVPNRKRIIYRKGMITLEREPRETQERFLVYSRAADEGDPDYSPLAHDAPHHEGPHTPEDMREWASWYAFTKMDDGTYQAELDEAWWWGGGHNDGGTIRTPIPEEWHRLPYEDFLRNVVRLSAASHYGFTAEILMKRDGLKSFFGF